MSNNPEPGQIVLTLTRIDEDEIRTQLQYNFEGIPEDVLDFYHFLKDGLMLLASEPHEIAQEALKLYQQRQRMDTVLGGFNDYSEAPQGEDPDFDPDLPNPTTNVMPFRKQ